MGREGRMNLQVRAEFQNIFNRLFLTTPTSNNPITPTLRNNANNTQLSAGFGFVNSVNGFGARPRSGLAVVRFTF